MRGPTEPAPMTLCLCGCAWRNHKTPTFSYGGGLMCFFNHSKMCGNLHPFMPKQEAPDA